MHHEQGRPDLLGNSRVKALTPLITIAFGSTVFAVPFKHVIAKLITHWSDLKFCCVLADVAPATPQQMAHLELLSVLILAISEKLWDSEGFSYEFFGCEGTFIPLSTFCGTGQVPHTPWQSSSLVDYCMELTELMLFWSLVT